jgi:hypothetical protein
MSHKEQNGRTGVFSLISENALGRTFRYEFELDLRGEFPPYFIREQRGLIDICQREPLD